MASERYRSVASAIERRRWGVTVRLFDAATLEPLAEVPTGAKVVGIADAPGNRFVFSLFEAGEIWVVDAADPRRPQVTRHRNIGRQPYDGFITPNGRYYIAGLYGEDGLTLLDPMVVALDRLGLFDRSRAPGPDAPRNTRLPL